MWTYKQNLHLKAQENCILLNFYKMLLGMNLIPLSRLIHKIGYDHKNIIVFSPGMEYQKYFFKENIYFCISWDIILNSISNSCYYTLFFTSFASSFFEKV